MTRRRVPVAFAALLALVSLLVGCSGEQDPRAELDAAVAATASEPFRFAISAQADRAALDELGADATAAASFLAEAGITGARDPDGWLQVGVTIGGDVPLLEAIVPDDDRLLLRTGLGDLLGLEGRDPGEALDPALTELGVDENGRAALTISFRGGWIALTDVSSIADLVAGVGGADGAGQDGAAGTDGAAGSDGSDAGQQLADLLDAVTVLGVHDVGEVRRFDVEVSTAALLGALGVEGGDRRVPGTIDLRAGRLFEARLELTGSDLDAVTGGDLGGAGASDGGAGTSDGGTGTPDGEAAGDAGRDAGGGGSIEVVVRVATADEGAPVVERPEPGASLTAAELFALFEQLQGAPGQPLP